MNNIVNLDNAQTDCNCDANIFYKNYKDKIEAILVKSSTVSNVSTVESQTISGLKTVSGQKPEFGQKSVSVQKTAFGQRTVSDQKSELVKKKSLMKRKSSFIQSKPVQPQRRAAFQSHGAIEVTPPMTTFSTALVEKTADMVGSPLTVVDSKASKDEVEIPEDHVSVYDEALSTKIDEILGEGEEEDIRITEQGYFEFDRFTEPFTEPSTMYKLSTKSTISIMPICEEEEEGEGGREEAYYIEKAPEEWKSESMKNALDYLKVHRIGDFFNFMGAHLVAANPCNPVDFLINLMDKCINYRLGYTEPPLLYQPRHIESLFDSMDPMRTEQIDLNQYATGMRTLGIMEFNRYPEVTDRNMVEKKTFSDEAFKYLRKNLDELLQCPAAVVNTLTTVVTSISSLKGETIDTINPGNLSNY